MVRWTNREHALLSNPVSQHHAHKPSSAADTNLLGIEDAGLALLITAAAGIDLRLFARIQREVDLEHGSGQVGVQKTASLRCVGFVAKLGPDCYL
jgi:hypothetical protein